MGRELDSSLYSDEEFFYVGFDEDDDMNPVDKMPIEDKLIAAYEQGLVGLETWEISEMVQDALSKLPNQEDADFLFDIMYDLVVEALDRARG